MQENKKSRKIKKTLTVKTNLTQLCTHKVTTEFTRDRAVQDLFRITITHSTFLALYHQALFSSVWVLKNYSVP